MEDFTHWQARRHQEQLEKRRGSFGSGAGTLTSWEGRPHPLSFLSRTWGWQSFAPCEAAAHILQRDIGTSLGEWRVTEHHPGR